MLTEYRVGPRSSVPPCGRFLCLPSQGAQDAISEAGGARSLAEGREATGPPAEWQPFSFRRRWSRGLTEEAAALFSTGRREMGGGDRSSTPCSCAALALLPPNL